MKAFILFFIMLFSIPSFAEVSVVQVENAMRVAEQDKSKLIAAEALAFQAVKENPESAKANYYYHQVLNSLNKSESAIYKNKYEELKQKESSNTFYFIMKVLAVIITLVMLTMLVIFIISSYIKRLNESAANRLLLNEENRKKTESKAKEKGMLRELIASKQLLEDAKLSIKLANNQKYQRIYMDIEEVEGLVVDAIEVLSEGSSYSERNINEILSNVQSAIQYVAKTVK